MSSIKYNRSSNGNFAWIGQYTFGEGSIKGIRVWFRRPYIETSSSMYIDFNGNELRETMDDLSHPSFRDNQFMAPDGINTYHDSVTNLIDDLQTGRYLRTFEGPYDEFMKRYISWEWTLEYNRDTITLNSTKFHREDRTVLLYDYGSGCETFWLFRDENTYSSMLQELNKVQMRLSL